MALRNIDIGAGASAFLEPERKKGIVIDIPILLITLSIAVSYTHLTLPTKA